MTEKPKISLIVPIYRVEPYLRKCLDSIVGQTYQNLQIILVDDGSPDNCGAICDEYAAGDGRICVIHKENGGVSSARNAGLECASGKWICFVDADDWIEPDMCQYLQELTLRSNADIVQCGVFWEEAGRRAVMYAADREVLLEHGADSFHAHVRKYLSYWSCTKLYRRECLSGTRFDPAYVMGEDLLFVLQAFHRAGRIAFGTEPMYHYRQREGSACNAPPARATLQNSRRMLKQAIQEFADNGNLTDYCRTEQLRNDLDICSKVVCLRWTGEGRLIKEIRREIRKEIGRIFCEINFTGGDRLKFVLIGYFWPVYKGLLPPWKRWIAKHGEEKRAWAGLAL